MMAAEAARLDNAMSLGTTGWRSGPRGLKRPHAAALRAARWLRRVHPTLLARCYDCPLDRFNGVCH